MPTEPTKASYAEAFPHSFDDKGRITVPSDWRLPWFETSLHIFAGDGCLRIYPASFLGKLQDKVADLPTLHPKRVGVENLSTQAQNATFDTQGRIMVKEKWRKHANLKKEAWLVGRSNHFQVWDKAAWEAKDIATQIVEVTLTAMDL